MSNSTSVLSVSQFIENFLGVYHGKLSLRKQTALEKDYITDIANDLLVNELVVNQLVNELLGNELFTNELVMK